MLRERELVKILRSSGCLRADLPGGSLRRRRAGRRCPSTAVRHTITTSPLEFLEPGKPLPRDAGRRRGATATAMRRTCSRSSRGTPASGRAPVELTGDDVAFMVYTSGTTGDAKGAMNTHRNVVFATSVYEALDRPDARRTSILGLAPLFHVTGLIGHVTLAMLTGSPLVLFYRFDADEACRLAAAASRHVHGLRGHGVHRAAQQRRDRASTTCRR